MRDKSPCLPNRDCGVLYGPITGKRIDGVHNGEVSIDGHEDQQVDTHEGREMVDELR
jgi:hypothetical protein